MSTRIFYLVVLSFFPLMASGACEFAVCTMGDQCESGVDTDKDGLTDAQELSLGTKPTRPDSDNDGHTDWWEVCVGGDPLNYRDARTLPIDEDTNKDGIPDAKTGVSYGYHRPDYDNDGISNALESGFPDADNNGIVDDLTDNNTNGIPDVAETGLPLLDTDNDGTPNYIDADSDQDGISDKLEHGQKTDGSPNYFDTNPGLLDPDGDGLINSVDLDSDNDGVLDIDEAPLRYSDLSGTAQQIQDLDGDGKVDEIRDMDGDGITDNVDTDFVVIPFTDADNDGIVDYADLTYSAGYKRQFEIVEEKGDYAYLPADPNLGWDTDRDGILDEYDNMVGGAYNMIYRRSFDLPDDNDGDGIYAWLDADEPTPTPGAAAAMQGNRNSGGGTFGLLMLVMALPFRRQQLLR